MFLFLIKQELGQQKKYKMNYKSPFLIWITGLAGSGKTTIGKEVYKIIKEDKNDIFFLDGDVFREIFGSNLGYDINSRFETATKISNFCKALVEQNISVVCSTISLFNKIHELNKKNIENYFEIFLDVDFEELNRRDQKNIYSKAINGDIRNVIGVDLAYEKPIYPNLVIDNNVFGDILSKSNRIIELVKI